MAKIIPIGTHGDSGIRVLASMLEKARFYIVSSQSIIQESLVFS